MLLFCFLLCSQNEFEVQEFDLCHQIPPSDSSLRAGSLNAIVPLHVSVHKVSCGAPTLVLAAI